MSDTTRGNMPQILYAHASPKSSGEVSLFDESLEGHDFTSTQGPDFTSSRADIAAATEQLRAAGFEILEEGSTATTINIAGPPELYERYFQVPLVTEQREVIRPGSAGERETVTFVDCPTTSLSGLIPTDRSPVVDVVEGVAIEEPVFPFRGTPVNASPPRPGYWHLTVPRKVAELLDADKLHQEGIRGAGVRLAMVDSGWWGGHPYFAERRLSGSVVLGPGAEREDVDENGHGTGESANVFALAPDIDFTMVKANFENILGSFNAAVNQNPRPHIVSNSWGGNVAAPPLTAIGRAMVDSITAAVADGITVVFSAGNGHYGFPAQHPDVIAAGGVYIDNSGGTQASNYASGFRSRIYPDRIVPDVCGLVGMQPHAMYIMLPVPPGCEIDQELSGRNAAVFPEGDETRANDGWAAFSGTSAAAPQIAGICALLREAYPELSPRGIRNALMSSARDVQTGASNPSTNGGSIAGPGHDEATGWGLASASAAVAAAVFQM
ncbi:S8 family serine peptidase [Streptomyces sp. NPDC041068]|uniref:S8 family serine peptidase n=1 Tax=Streptomyces sp. NPDC041068 TaxID=3155130 RepID=UPI0033F67EA0